MARRRNGSQTSLPGKRLGFDGKGSAFDTPVVPASARIAPTAVTCKQQIDSMNLPRHAELWFVPYLKDRLRRSARPTKPKRAWVSITDHYEPLDRKSTRLNSSH